MILSPSDGSPSDKQGKNGDLSLQHNVIIHSIGYPTGTISIQVGGEEKSDITKRREERGEDAITKYNWRGDRSIGF